MQTKPLANHHILVTRPNDAGQELTRLLKQAGAHVYHLPTIEIVPTLSTEQWHAIIQNNHATTLAIFTSQAAVHHSQPILTHWHTTNTAPPIATIGNRTAQALKRYGLQANIIAPPPYNSESLLKTLAQQPDLLNRIVLFKGAGGRTYLTGQLSKQCTQLVEVICYQRCLPQIPPTQLAKLSTQPIDVIIYASITAIENLFTLYQHSDTQWLTKPQWLVVSQRMAVAAKPYKLAQPSLIALPENRAIVGTLIAWSEQNHVGQ